MELDETPRLPVFGDDDSEVSTSADELFQSGRVAVDVGPVVVPAADVDDGKSIQTSSNVRECSSGQSGATLKQKSLQLTTTLSHTRDTLVGDFHASC